MKLLLIAPCQIALQDPDQGHSLIAVFHEIKIRIPEDAPQLPVNAIIPKEWAIFSKFGLEPEEEGKDYSLDTTIFWPDGAVFATQVICALQPTRNGLAFIVRLQGFPMGQNGVVKVSQTLLRGERVVYEGAESEIRMSVERTLPAGATIG
jgi:hypothetical protein